MKINCLLIDDEHASQSVVKTFAEKVGFLHIVASCNNAIDALRFLNENNNIDLLFLDINMPEISGLSFYKSLQKKPFVIFTTAHPQYAVEGFELNAIDYLLKPFSFDRFLSAVNKVAKEIASKNKLKNDAFILIKSSKKLHKINTDTIYYIEAYGDYVKVHLENSFLVTYSKFTTFLQSIGNTNFVQIHKSYAVNLDKIDFIEGNQIIIQHHKIPIGLTFKKLFLERF